MTPEPYFHRPHSHSLAPAGKAAEPKKFPQPHPNPPTTPFITIKLFTTTTIYTAKAN
jgi:hypothetical protein